MNSTQSKPSTGAGSKVEFLQVLKLSGLLSPEHFAQVAGLAVDEPRKIASLLFKNHLLTRWQAQQILAGQHRLILGKYKLLDKLGEGGMGAVYKAEHLSLQRIVAIKVINQEVLGHSDAVERFHREVQTVAAVDHTNIIRALDADQLGNIHFLVMEYIEGCDLRTWLSRRGVLPVAWACECIRQAALGLEHAHQRGLVHRDIKPGNILVADDEDSNGLPRVKLLDLGLAKFTSEKQTSALTQTGICMGTIDYLAPEQAKDTKSVDIRADIYGLGATLFRLVTGEVPYPGGTSLEKLVARTTEDPPPASSLREEVPPVLDAVIAKMMKRDPNERFTTPGEVAEALRPFSLATMDDPCQESSFLQLPDVGGLSLGSIEADEDQALSTFLNSNESTVRTQPQAPKYEPTVRTQPSAAAPEYEPTRIVSRTADGSLPGVEVSNAADAEPNIDNNNLLLWGSAAAAVFLLGGALFMFLGSSSPTPAATPESIKQSTFVDPEVNWNDSERSKPQPRPTRVATNLPSQRRVTPPPATPRASNQKPIDLIELIDLKRDVLQGEWTKPGVLLSERSANCKLNIPVVPPQEYVLAVAVEPKVTGESFEFGLIVANTHLALRFDADVEPAASTTPTHEHDAMYFGKLLHRGRKNQLKLIISPSRLCVVCDNRVVFDQPVDYRQYAIADAEAFTNNHLWLKTDGYFEFKGFRLTPQEGEARVDLADVRKPSAGNQPVPTSPPAGSGSEVELLTQVDLEKDVQRGNWSRESGGLVLPGSMWPVLKVPYALPADYRVVLRVERKTFCPKAGIGNELMVMLPGPAGMYSVSLDSAGGQLAVLANASGSSIKFPCSDFLLPKDQIVEVQIELRNSHLRVACDGNQVIDYAQPARLSIIKGAWKNFVHSKDLHLAGYSSSFLIHSIKFVPLADD